MNRTKKNTPLLLLTALLTYVGGSGCARNGAADGAANAAGSPAAAPPANAAAGKPAFREVAGEAGLNYKWEVAGKRPLNILQTIGNGCAFLDYDNDGNLDVLLVGPKVALFRGDGKGKFADVSAQTGVGALKGNFLGCAVGDADGDGWPDIYLTAYRGGALLKNNGGKAFADISKTAGIGPQPWGTSALFFDAEGDGDLDLFVGNYVVFGPTTDPQLCDNNGIKSSCGPRFYKPEQSRMFRNEGNARFKDVTEAWGFHALKRGKDGVDSGVEGKALGVAAADLSGTGKPSVALANDEMPGDLLVPTGGKYENQGKTSATAYDDSGNVHGGMGVDWGDYDNDGQLDLFVGTFQNEAKNVYRNDGDGLFSDRSAALGLASALPLVTFGAKWLDYDNDGWLDLILANGHVQDNIAEIDRTSAYRQEPRLYRSKDGQRFEEAGAAEIAEGGRKPIVGRGLAVGDYDNDGRTDVLIVDSEGSPLLLHNEKEGAGHWVGFAPKMPGTRNPQAFGAVLTVEAGGKKWVRQCTPGGSYMSSSDPRVHVGLGAAARADRVTVRWPGGKTETWADLPADRYHALTRGNGKPAARP